MLSGDTVFIDAHNFQRFDGAHPLDTFSGENS